MVRIFILIKTIFFACLAGTLLALPTVSASGSDDLDALLQELQVQDWSEAYVEHIVSMPFITLALADQYRADWQASVELAFDEQDIIAVIRQTYQDRLSEEQISEALRLARSDLSQKELAAALAIKDYTYADYETYRSEHKDYAAQEPERYTMYLEVTELYHVEQLAGVREILSVALTELCCTTLAEQYLDSAMPALEQSTLWIPMTQTMMTYENFSNDELELTLASLKSPLGQAMIAANQSLLPAVLQHGIKSLAHEFGERIALQRD